MAAQRVNLFPCAQTNALEQGGYLSTKSTPELGLLPDGIAKDVPNFRLHAATVARGAALKAFLYIVFDIANEDLRHDSTHLLLLS